MIWLLAIPAVPVVGLVLLFLYCLVDPHTHHCRCDNRWWHTGMLSAGAPSLPRSRRAHTCRRCGRVQRWRCGEVDEVYEASAGAAFKR